MKRQYLFLLLLLLAFFSIFTGCSENSPFYSQLEQIVAEYGGADGGGGEPAKTAAPVFSPSHGGLLGPSDPVSISCSTPGSIIYYTIDGSEPDATSTEYSAPFTLSVNRTVKAVALSPDLLGSDTASKAFKLQRIYICTEQSTSPGLESRYLDGTGGITGSGILGMIDIGLNPNTSTVFVTTGAMGGDNSIHTMNFDLTYREQIYGPGMNPLHGIDIDPVNNLLYFVNWQTGELFVASISSSLAPITLGALFTPQIRKVRKDPNTGYLYIGNQTGTPTVGRANSDGSNPVAIVPSGYPAEGLAIDPAEGILFFTVLGQPGLYSHSLDGSGSVTLIHNGTDPLAVATDTYRKKVYWAENAGGIYRADYDGQNVELVFTSSMSYIRGMDIDL